MNGEVVTLTDDNIRPKRFIKKISGRNSESCHRPGIWMGETCATLRSLLQTVDKAKMVDLAIPTKILDVEKLKIAKQKLAMIKETLEFLDGSGTFNRSEKDVGHHVQLLVDKLKDMEAGFQQISHNNSNKSVVLFSLNMRPGRRAHHGQADAARRTLVRRRLHTSRGGLCRFQAEAVRQGSEDAASTAKSRCSGKGNEEIHERSEVEAPGVLPHQGVLGAVQQKVQKSQGHQEVRFRVRGRRGHGQRVGLRLSNFKGHQLIQDQQRDGDFAKTSQERAAQSEEERLGVRLGHEGEDEEVGRRQEEQEEGRLQ